LFEQLLAIKPKRLAQDKANGMSFRLTVLFKSKSIRRLKISIGFSDRKIFFQQPRTMNTFVRLFNDVDVYEVDGFLDMTSPGANI
jgi:hypothetical protein